MSDMGIRKVMELRLLIAALGEQGAKPWWRSQFLRPVGRSHMERVLPRAWHVALVESAFLAAQREHDAHVGPRRFHLFRLPVQTEELLTELARRDGAALLNAIPVAREGVLAALFRFGTSGTVTPAEGPRALGSVANVTSANVLMDLATLYTWAAREGKRAYPYFDPVDGDK